VDDGSYPGLTTLDHGVYADVGAFYASGKGLNKLGFAARLFFRFAKWQANSKISHIHKIQGKDND
jgi:hypothetical protein